MNVNAPSGLTPTQLHTLEAIRRYIKATGTAPTFQEMADEFGITKVSVFERLQALERKGYIRRRRGIRNIELVDSPARRLAELVLERFVGDHEAVALASSVINCQQVS